MKGWTNIGDTLPLALVSLAAMVVLFVRGHRKSALLVPAVAAGYLLVLVLKPIVSRARPGANEVQIFVHETGKSFPSGHAFAAALMLGAIFYLADSIVGTDRRAVLVMRVVLVFVILSIAASRVYLGVHWTSDVLGGLFLGGLTLYIIVRAFDAGLQWTKARWGDSRIVVFLDKAEPSG
ncbi:MAG: phosphatase PAP2 family protein [Chloroflexi bacterium]|nr:phosphatase PAP2 family protein [Chloroflexota bacterium]